MMGWDWDMFKEIGIYNLDSNLGQDILIGSAKFVGPHKVKYGLPGRVDVGGEVSARDIIIATGSVPFVPPGMT